MMRRVVGCAFAACAAFAFASVPAQATPILDFRSGDAGAGGHYMLSGSNASAVSIPIGALLVTGAPTNNGVYPVRGDCFDEFGNGFGCLEFNTAVDAIRIIGSIPGLGVATSVLMTGSLTGFMATLNGLLDASGTDTKSAALLTVIGLAGNTPFEFFGFALSEGANGPVASTDIRNTAVPEPASMLLLGTGLLGIGMGARRRRNSNNV